MKPRIIILLILFALNINAQSTKSESEMQEIQFFIQLSDKLLYSNTDTALFYAKTANKFANENNIDTLKPETNFKLAFCYFLKGETDIALKYLDTAIASAEKENNTEYLINSYNITGAIYNTQDNNDLAIRYFDKALKLAVQNKDSFNIAKAYGNIGRSYLSLLNKRKDAKKFLIKALDIYKAINADSSELAGVYSDLSDAVSIFEQRIMYIDKAIKITEKEQNLPFLSELYLNKGIIYTENNNFKEADKWLKKALKLAKETNFTPNYRVALLELASNSINLNDFKTAEEYINEYDKHFDYKQTTIYNRKWYLDTKSQIFANKNDFAKAYELRKEYGYLSDSLEDMTTNEQFIKYNKMFELSEKDKQIAQQELKIAQEKTKRNVLIFSVIILLLLALAIFQWYIFKQKQKKQLAEHKLHKEQEMNNLRTKFLENIAHEIRTPISLINGYLSLALENLNNEKILTKNIKSALSNSNKVLSNANEILELLKLQKGMLPVKKTAINIDSFLRDIVFSFSSLAELKKIKLVYNSNIPENIVVESDKNRIEKILNNFISNAIKFSPSESKIIVDVNITNGNLIIKVTDFGEGIAKSEQEKIFQRFYQTPSSSNVGGVGVGLSLAKDFAESLNGTISVESEPGKGATFIVSIPVKETKLESQSNTVSSNISAKINIDNNEKEDIIIVEDNPEMNAYITEILSPFFNCDIAFTGVEALQKIKSKKYKLIISDIMMPQMSGEELKQELNKTKHLRTIPFIFLTAKTLTSDKIRGYNLGIDDFITKPFSKDELIARINNLLKNKQERENWLKENLEFIDESKTAEDEILEKVKDIIMQNISDEKFKVSDLAEQVGYSQRQLSRLLKKLTGLSPNQLIMEIRLQTAYKHLINKTFLTLAEVRYSVGIISAGHFNKKFTERFGVNPGEVK